MDARVLFAIAVMAVLPATPRSQSGTHLNGVVDLLAAHKPVFGVYAPRNPRARPGGAPVADTARQKPPAELAKEALGYTTADYVFDGTMEGDFDRAFPTFEEFVKGIAEGSGGMIERNGAAHFHHPLIVKVHEIAPDPAKATQHIGDQLNLGVNGVVFVGVESPEEVKTGLAAMRFKSRGGTRPREGDRGGEGHRRAVPRGRHASRCVHDDGRQWAARLRREGVGSGDSTGARGV